MRQVLFIHSAGPQGVGEGSSLFLAALRAELGADYDVNAPIMPEPDNPEAGPWARALGQHLAAARGPVAVVGHSFGGSTILKCLAEEGVPAKVAGVVTIAAPFWGPTAWDVPEFALPSDAEAALAAVPQIVIFRGREDSDVTADHLTLYKQAIPKAETREVAGDHEFATGDVAAVADAIRALPGFAHEDR